MPGYGLADWVSALEARDCKPRRSGEGYKALCPAHDDKHPSLTLDEGDTQEVVAYCHVGCEFEQVRAALGLDRWDGRPAGLQVVKSAPAKSVPPKPPTRLPAGAWIYLSADGAPLMATTRQELPEGKKSFWQWRPVEGGLWVAEGPEAPKPLYGLPELAADAEARVVVVEGEKCVDAWRRAWPELLVTTWPGGCKAWQLADWTPLAGRDVAIVADADQGGRTAGQGIAGRLHGLGCEVQVGLPEGETGEDVADWIAADGPDVALAKVEALLQPFVPPDPGPETEPVEGDAEGEDVGLGLYRPAGSRLGLEPLGDARRLLDAHAGELLLAKGTNERGEVETTVYALQPSGLWTRDPERLAQWHDEQAERWESQAVAFLTDENAARAVRTYAKRSRKLAGAAEAIGNVPILAHHLRDRGELHDALTECEDTDLDGLQWLGAPNGVIDLTTGRLLPPDEGRLALVTQALPDPYDPAATHPDVDKLTAHLSDELAGYLWDAIAYCLHGRPARSFLLVVGDPGGGKSTLVVAVRVSLGTCYADALAEGAITPTRGGRGANSATPDMATVMPPRRLAVAAEVENLRPDRARLKALTGGDPQAWRPLYKGIRTDVPSASLMLYGNSAPALGLDDPALAERTRAVPYPPIPESERDEGLIHAFESDRPGAVKRRQALAAKLVRHAAKLTPGSPPKPPTEALAELDRIREEDIGEVGVWLRDNIRRGAEGNILTSNDVHTAIGATFSTEGEGREWRVDGMSRQQVTARLRKLHKLPPAKQHRTKSGIVRGWAGWRIARQC